MEPETAMPAFVPEKKVSRKTHIILVGILLIATACALYFNSQVRALEQDPNKVNQEKVNALVEKLGKLIDLPQGEVPSAATITDPKLLAGNPFFAKAKVGDEVLLYTGASKAFLYDPVNNIVVEVATINLGTGPR